MNGTFACPICGQDTPHGHPNEVVVAYRADQIRNDGWTSTIKAQPTESGWYLCRDVDVPSTQNLNDSQLGWFLWVRDGKAQGQQIPEVLHYCRMRQRWTLRNLLGNASISGRESRWEVEA